MIKKVVTLGEIMLRLSTQGDQRFVQSEKFDATFGGAEANVAASLSNYGLQNQFFCRKFLIMRLVKQELII
jgi:2-dehydro-3-deoxygluconokinase